MRPYKSLILLFLAIPLTLGQESCTPDMDSDGWTTEEGDCDDSNAEVYPGALEVCDGVDQDCDGRVDDLADCYQGEPPVVSLNSGPIQGFAADEDTFAYLGIPFAAPPMGENRWLAPQDPEPWSETLEATAFGPACAQAGSADTDGDGENEFAMVGEEDCLYLNVWQPQSPGDEPRPIMFWIHGGGNTTGSASGALYNGAKLAAEGDAIVVSISYRLNLFGYFLHQALQTGDIYGDSGNLGTLDIIQALKWVRANGEAFGGDISRVTVFGESAGGYNTWAMLLSPLASGYFHRGLMESGCPAYATADEARANAQQVLEWLVVADGLTTAEEAAAFLEAQGDAWIQDYLYAKPAEEMLQVVDEQGGLGLATYGPIQDGLVMPSNAHAALMAGDYNRVPILLGANQDEMKLFLYSYADMNEVQYEVAMQSLFGDRVDEIEALYPREAYDPATPYNQFTDISDGFLEMMCSEYFAWVVSSYQNTYLYHFRYDDLVVPLDYTFGAAHGLELPFVFGVTDDSLYAQDTEAERYTLTRQVQSYWSCFASTGSPSSCGGTDEWPLYSGEGSSAFLRMVLDAPLAVEPIPDINFERWNLWVDVLGYDTPMIPVGEE